MTQFTLIFALFTLTILPGWTKFQTDFSKGEKVVLTREGDSDTLFIGYTTIEEVLKKYGQVKVTTQIAKFPGKTTKQLYEKRQIIEYKDKGLTFIFEGNEVKPQKSAIKDICLLNEIIINAPSNYCLDNICTGTTKNDIIKKIDDGIYGITNGVTDSLSRVWYNSLGLWLSYKQTADKIVLVQIHRQETESYFKYKQKENYKKQGIPFPLDSVK